MKFLFFTVFCAFLLTGCALVESNDRQRDSPSPENSTRTDEAKKPTPNKIQPIREIDFGNFTYSWCNDENPTDLTVKLSNSKLSAQRKLQNNEKERVIFSLANVYYQDFTLDGNEEALVTITSLIEPGTSDVCTYLFTMKQENLEVLWTHNNGDEDKQVRKIYAEESTLIVEEYLYRPTGKEEISRVYPNTINRLKYQWDGNGFVQINSEYFPHDEKAIPFFGYPKNQESSHR